MEEYYVVYPDGRELLDKDRLARLLRAYWGEYNTGLQVLHREGHVKVPGGYIEVVNVSEE